MTSSIKNVLFTDQISSLGINPQTETLILLDISRKKEPMLIIQPAISAGESMEMLLVSHDMTTFFMDGGIVKFMARHSTFSARSPPIPEFNDFNGVKNLCHTFEYLKSPAIMESPRNKMFVNYFLKGDNISGDIPTNLIFQSEQLHLKPLL